MPNRTYEVMYIVDPETDAERVEKLNEAVGKLIEKEGGEIVRMDDIGLRGRSRTRSRKRRKGTMSFLRSTAQARRSPSSSAVCVSMT